MLSFYLSLIFLLLSTSCGSPVCAEEEERIQSEKSEEVQDLIRWMRANGGFLDPRVEIRRVDSSDPSSYYGVFANAPIQEDEVILRIPDKLKIRNEDDGEDWYYSEMICALSWALAKEFEKGDESKYLPYINYLRTQEKGQIPGAWSSASKELLLQVQGDLRIGDRDEEEEDEEPEYLVNWLEDYAHEECAIGKETLDPHYIALAVQRGYDSCLVPIYDMINHSNNPKKINIINYSYTDENDEFIVHAMRNIGAGEELFYSYDNCPECEDAAEFWGSPELLRDFGFVEDYPQVFYITPDMPIFVEQVETDDGQLSHVATCIYPDCPEKAWVEGKVQNLIDLEKTIADAASTVPEKELAIIKEYHKALLTAFSSIWSQSLYR